MALEPCSLSPVLGSLLTVVTTPWVMLVADALGVPGHGTGRIVVWGAASLWFALSMAGLYSSNYKEYEARCLAARRSQ
jgi:hypothetical protein